MKLIILIVICAIIIFLLATDAIPKLLNSRHSSNQKIPTMKPHKDKSDNDSGTFLTGSRGTFLDRFLKPRK